ncbi:MAG: HupE/UreJ family protein [Gammaproteobacteria bacterium]|jgi:hydrogenase/urease accessory protein HupE
MARRTRKRKLIVMHRVVHSYGRVFLALLVLVFPADYAAAHRLSPGFFGLTETAPNVFAAQWKVSISGGLSDVLEPQLPDGCSVDGNVRRFTVEDARLMHAVLLCESGLRGKRFVVSGLEATQTDVLLRVGFLDGRSFTHRLVPEAPAVDIPYEAEAFDVIVTYLSLGIEHILLGIDHLLFVLALLLLVRGWRRLVATITAFTLAHSVTLAAAALGYVHLPSAPVEAIIALSILFLATELARREQRGARSVPDDLAERAPWIVAFSFGLLHGLGFAGALSEIGLPENAIPLSLLFFNVGVEIGQLAFVACILALGWAARTLSVRGPDWLAQLAAYAIGSVAALWLFERTLTSI